LDEPFRPSSRCATRKRQHRGDHVENVDLEAALPGNGGLASAKVDNAPIHLRERAEIDVFDLATALTAAVSVRR
jgi:hypothetical protein